MFKFQWVIKTTIAENQDYYKRLTMDSNKLEDNGFTKISRFFLRKFGLIQYNTDSYLFGKYKNNKLCLLLTLYVDDILIAGENKETINVVSKIKHKYKVSSLFFKCIRLSFGSLLYCLGIDMDFSLSKANMKGISCF